MRGTDSINVDNYKCFLNNRSKLHTRAKKGSGGVSILIKEDLLNCYSIDIIDKDFDGILGLKFISVHGHDSFVIFSCYLPPQDSVWSDPTNFYAHLLAKVYEYSDYDIFICGDFNACIGNLSDCIETVDNLPPRKVIDKEKTSLVICFKSSLEMQNTV